MYVNVTKGNDVSFLAQLVTTTGQPVDITDIEIYCDVVEYNGTKVFSAGIQKVSPTDGLFRIIFSRDKTSLLTSRKFYLMDILLVLPDGRRRNLPRGGIVVRVYEPVTSR
ncbi:MAG: hypothetical protein QW687_00145 [Candidatus Hadarchaeales archaeon]